MILKHSSDMGRYFLCFLIPCTIKSTAWQIGEWGIIMGNKPHKIHHAESALVAMYL